MTTTIGILIAARDAASPVLAGVNRSLSLTRAAGDRAASGLAAAGRFATGANQALELLKKGIEVTRFAFQALASASYESRTAGDAVRASLDGTARAAGLLQRSVGDALLPALAGVGAAVSPLLTRLGEWVTANRAVIATGIAEWIAGIGRVIVAVGVPAVKLLHTAWAGVQIALEALRGIQARVLEALASGTGTVLQGAALAARAFGRDGLTASIEGAAQEAEQSKTIFASMGAESSRKILEIDRAAKETRRTIDEGAVSISKALGQIVPNAAKLAAASIQRIGGVDWSKVLGQPDEAIKRYRQIEDALAARQIARENALVSQRIQLDATETTRAIRAATAREGAVLAIRAQMEEEAANDGSSAEARRLAARTLAARGEIVSIRAVAAEAATIDEKIANIRGALGQVTQGLGQAIVRGGDVGQVVISNLQSLAGNVIQLLIDKLAELAAASIFKGILNIFTGGIGGAIGGIFGFASGGIVPSTAGIPGVDSVPALLTPGERVLSVRETRALASGALTAGGGGNVTINVDTRGSVLPESPADLERRVRPIEAAGRRAARATGGRRS